MPESYFLTEADLRKLRKLFRDHDRLERQVARLRGRATPRDSNVQSVRITSTTQEDGRYPGRLLAYSAEDGTWDDATGADDVWVVARNDTALAEGVRYDALDYGVAGGRPVFAADDVGLGDGVTVKEADNAPSYAGVVTLLFDQADGFSLSQPLAGQARVDIVSAAAGQNGVVDQADQHLGAGRKSADAFRATSADADGLAFNATAGSYRVYVDGSLYFGDLTGDNRGRIYFLETTDTDAGGHDGEGELRLYAKGVNVNAFDVAVQGDTFLLVLNASAAATTPAYALYDSSGTLRTGATGSTGGLTFYGGVYTGGTATGVTDGDKGDVTVSGSGSTWTIDNNAVTPAKLDDGAACSVLGRGANSAGDRADIAASANGQVLRRSGDAVAFGAVDLADADAVTGALAVGNGGTGQTSAAAAFDALAPGTSKGDVIVHNGTDHVRLAVGTDGHVLTADSAEAAGVKWAAATGVSDGDKGDITVSGSGTVWSIDFNVVGNGELRDSAGLSVIGRSASSSGDPADITAGTDGHVLRRSGTTLGFGTVATAGIGDDQVTYAKLQNVSAESRLLGRGAGSGAGNAEEITLGSGLSMAGTTLNASASLADGDRGDITVSMLGTVWTVDNDVVTYAKMQNVSAGNRLLGRGAGAGDPEEITLGSGLTMTGTTLNTTLAASLQADMETATALTNYVTPGRQQYHPSAAKVWCNFTGTGVVTINEDWNVDSITDNGTGDYTIDFSTDFAGDTYCWVASGDISTAVHNHIGGLINQRAKAAGSLRLATIASSGAASDYEVVNVVAFGDQ